MKHPSSLHRRAAFLLLETMLGVTIFAIGMLALAKAMQNCLDAEIYRRHDHLAARALQNTMDVLVSLPPGEMKEDEMKQVLDGRFEGITIRQTRKKLELKDEGGAILPNLYIVTLRAEWQGAQGSEFRELSFYAQAN